MNSKRLQILTLTFLSILPGCGADKRLEDWQREQVNENKLTLQSAAGVYRGELSDSKGTLLSVLEIKLTVDSEIIQSSDPTIQNQERAVLKGQLTFSAGETVRVPLLDIAFDEQNQRLRASMIPELGLEALELRAQKNGTELSGTISIQGYPEYEAKFNVRLDAPEGDESKATLWKQNAKGMNEGELQIFRGDLRYSDRTEPSELILYQRPLTRVRQLLDQFRPRRLVDATIRWVNKGEVYYMFSGASLDVSAGTLSGRSTVTINNAATEFTLNCKSDRDAWTCFLLSTNRGFLAEGRFEAMR